MQLFVEHETLYRYDPPARFTTQYIRTTLRQHGNLQVWAWSVTGPNKMTQFTDGFGNIVHVLAVTEEDSKIQLFVEGEVWTQDSHGVLPPEQESFNPLFYARATRLTAGDSALRDFAKPFRALLGTDRLKALQEIMAALHKKVRYLAGTTDVTSTAASAFAKGTGVCQDHTHIFLSLCGILGLPARYISGYLWIEDPDETSNASHAWVEAYVEDLGWVSFDVANGIAATDAYVRVALGRDYLDAAPVRGLWRGGGEETLLVAGRVNRREQQQSQVQS